MRIGFVPLLITAAPTLLWPQFAYHPDISKTWDEDALTDWATLVAGLNVRPRTSRAESIIRSRSTSLVNRQPEGSSLVRLRYLCLCSGFGHCGTGESIPPRRIGLRSSNTGFRARFASRNISSSGIRRTPIPVATSVRSTPANKLRYITSLCVVDPVLAANRWQSR